MSTATIDKKAVGIVDVVIKEIDAGGEAGEFEAVLSAPTLDRDGEVVAAKAFDPLPEWIPIDIDHAMGVRSTVASGQPFYDGDMLKFRGKFASTELGQEVRTLVLEGHIRKMSIVFMNPTRKVVEGVPHVVKGELLNAAFVNTPSNREADVTGAKRARAKAGARNSSKDSERLQQAHDLLVENGAECAAEEKAAAPTSSKAAGGPKTVAGSHEERTQNLRNAIRAANPDGWAYIVATFDDHVVYQLESWGAGESGTYQATYSFDDNGVTLGPPDAVEITEIVTPAKDADVDPESKAAAAAAASSPAETTLIRARAQVDEIEAFLA